MTLDKARELLRVQVSFGGAYNRNGARNILDAVEREHGAQAADSLLAEFRLDELFGLKPFHSRQQSR
ncbi:MAG TPA: hypothetical protein VFV55_02485 [Usitatibacteraceae bacterium]|nr:hypothetical protein [Usitatibacteraceae bacterium]